jgi:hypothetical protein
VLEEPRLLATHFQLLKQAVLRSLLQLQLESDQLLLADGAIRVSHDSVHQHGITLTCYCRALHHCRGRGLRHCGGALLLLHTPVHRRVPVGRDANRAQVESTSA